MEQTIPELRPVGIFRFRHINVIDKERIIEVSVRYESGLGFDYATAWVQAVHEATSGNPYRTKSLEMIAEPNAHAM